MLISQGRNPLIVVVNSCDGLDGICEIARRVVAWHFELQIFQIQVIVLFANDVHTFLEHQGSLH